MNQQQMDQIASGKGFIAALDQSGGSTPKALKLYGLDESAWQSEAQMFDLVHAMRARIVQSPAFDGRQALLQHVGRGIIEARIEVAGLCEVEDTSRVIAALEGEGIALIDGYRGSAKVLGGLEACV